MAEQFRVTTLGEPRGEWRDRHGAAVADAIRLDLASWDASRKEWYIAVPVAIERRGRPDLPPPRYPTRRPRLRERWSEEDIATLRLIARRGEGFMSAAAYLGRSVRAVKLKAQRLGIRLGKL